MKSVQKQIFFGEIFEPCGFSVQQTRKVRGYNYEFLIDKNYQCSIFEDVFFIVPYFHSFDWSRGCGLGSIQILYESITDSDLMV